MTQKDDEVISNTSNSDDTPVVREDESETDIEKQNTTEEELTEVDNTDANGVENNLIDRVVITVTRQSKLQITINLLLIIAIGCALLFFVTDAGIY